MTNVHSARVEVAHFAVSCTTCALRPVFVARGSRLKGQRMRSPSDGASSLEAGWALQATTDQGHGPEDAQ